MYVCNEYLWMDVYVSRLCAQHRHTYIQTRILHTVTSPPHYYITGRYIFINVCMCATSVRIELGLWYRGMQMYVGTEVCMYVMQIYIFWCIYVCWVCAPIIRAVLSRCTGGRRAMQHFHVSFMSLSCLFHVSHMKQQYHTDKVALWCIFSRTWCAKLCAWKKSAKFCVNKA